MGERSGNASRPWADATASAWPSHAELSRARQQRALELRPTPAGWLDQGPAADPRTRPTSNEATLTDFDQRLRAYLDTHAPPGHVGTAGAEAGIARACWVLTGWEQAYRGGQLPAELAALHQQPNHSTAGLLAGAGEDTVAELVRLAELAENSTSLQRLRESASSSSGALGTAGPVLVPHWADADLLIGDTLLDVKTVASAKNTQRTSQWLWQILAYAWLDTPDRYRIRSVGLYLARHGLVLQWGLKAFADHLAGSATDARRARSEFRQLAGRLMEAEGAIPPWQN